MRFVQGGEKELVEKLGRNDPCPCGSGKRFQALLHALGPVSTASSGTIIGGNRRASALALSPARGELIEAKRRLKGLDEFETPEFVGRMARIQRRRKLFGDYR